MATKETYNLFEFAAPSVFKESSGELDKLDVFLDEIWNKRDKIVLSFWGGEDKDTSQRFINFSRKPGNLSLKSRNYVGIVHFNGNVYNLLPKIFNDGKDLNEQKLASIQSHILWWLSYCHKFKFPKSFSSFKSQKANFFEVLIYLFASYTKDVLTNVIYQAYEEVQEDLNFMKGRLDFNTYITKNYVSGNHHKLNCIYSSFEMDNTFNRIVKYVAKLLLQYTSELDNKKNLQEILFILDDVKDIQATIHDCEKVHINPLFEDMFTVLDYCKLFLSNSMVLSYKNQLKVFAFLLPMEYVFEDFIYGFIKKELKDIAVKSQSATKRLTTEGLFALKPDLVFDVARTVGDKEVTKKIIADTKYKMIYPDGNDKKYGISEKDMYQMLTYAVRNKADEIKLFYPSTVNNLKQEKDINFKIKDEFADNVNIKIDAYQLPVIAEDWATLNIEESVNKSLEYVKEDLKEVLLKILS